MIQACVGFGKDFPKVIIVQEGLNDDDNLVLLHKTVPQMQL